ncbi:uncharacterized protein LAJ45_02834 [Morchella importuna]|uniref:uncharacterized protein n=1 Tax=Morchella importuna TaxID=1174673 RepID=UPI001E8D5A1D|nr:uncharacterized protein LAJ45_02834 [Morchella importuna]KAH8153247.1 hypothetical protein LAJ45_02834 [Morchella importuna]
MDSILAQQHNMPKNAFAQHTHLRPQNLSDSYPRSFQPAMASPLPDSFALWPPTPRTNGNRPATVHETSFPYSSLPEDCSTAVPAWDPTCLIPSESHSLGTSPVDLSQYDMNSNDWSRPRGVVGEYNLDTDVDRMGSSYGSSGSNSTNLLDPHYHFSPQQVGDALSLNTNVARRFSDTISMSSADQAALLSATDMFFDNSPYETSPYETSPYPESIISDYTHRSTFTMSTSTTPLSPVMSPNGNRIRSGSRGRASPSPSRTSMRAAPYSTVGRDANKRWSTGSFLPNSQTSSPYIVTQLDPCQVQNFHSSNSHHSSPTYSSPTYSSPTCGSAQCPPHPPQQMLLASHNHNFSRGGGYVQQQQQQQQQGPYVDDLGCQPQMPNHLFVKMLQSNAAEHYRSHYADFTDPPDLYASLQEEQIPPPAEDMNPEDPEMKPHEQDLRFEGDLYTPRWVRGHGNKREGWCGICKRWLVLKNSAFWYDKSFTHGISAATGQRFVEPKSVRRMEGNMDVWEGLCHSCNDWVALVSNKKKGTTWFRHAYKCHTHPKIKDAPKRRRESSQGKAAAAAAAAAAKTRQDTMNVKVEVQRQRHHHHY